MNTTTKAQHTPGRLHYTRESEPLICEDDPEGIALTAANGRTIATVRGEDADGDLTGVANADRLRDCWNACEGIADPSAVPELLEALRIVEACGEPTKVSLYDEEGIEGWRWDHPDGREWTEIGDWSDPPPLHPVAREAIAKATGN